MVKVKSWQDTILDHIDQYYRLAYCYTKNQQDASDIVQESLYKALMHQDNRTNPDAVKTWFYRIVVNTSLDFLKKEKKLVHLDDIQWNTIPADEPADTLDLREAVQALPFPYQTVIVLRYFEDLKIAEIARILSENENTIKTRIYSALKKLRIQLEEDI